MVQSIRGRKFFEVMIVPAENELHTIGLSYRLEQEHQIGLINDAVSIAIKARVRT